MDKNSLVSVLMPAYNHEAYVEKAIESVLQQTYSNIELIICDDCSRDLTPTLVETYANKYPDRISFHKGRKNRGVSNRFNFLCSKAKGRYIVPLASDDQLPKDGIEKRIRYLDSHPDVDIVATDMDVIDQHGKMMSKAEQYKIVPQFNRLYRVDFNDLYNSLLSGNFLPAGSLCIRIKRIKMHELHHDELCPNLHDYDVWLKLAYNHRWGFLPDSTFLYRWHGKNLSSPQIHDLKSLCGVISQSVYILSKQLMLDLNSKQKLLTLKNIIDYCSSLSGVIPKEQNNELSDKNMRTGKDTAARTGRTNNSDLLNETSDKMSQGQCSTSCTSSTEQVGQLLILGKDLLVKGKLKESCDTFIKVLDIDTVNFEAAKNLGIIAMQAHNTEQAAFFFKQAIEIDPRCKNQINGLMVQMQKDAGTSLAYHY
jgi:glycosyltransferase involved in cell wall biosynthesis